MDENEKIEGAEREDDKFDGRVKIKMPVSERLENFWYHYKWHTIVSVFVTIVIVVLTVQFCSREKYDVFILYMGDKTVMNSVAEGEDVPERMKFLNSFKAVSSDYDENGEVNVAFKSLYRPDQEEIDRRKAENLEIAEGQILEDQKAFESLLAQSEYYLLFLDLAVFNEYSSKSNMIASVEPYLPKDFSGPIVKNGVSSAIYLRDTGFYEFEGIRDLPSDTVICIKFANVFASEAEEKKREEAIEVFKNIAAMPARERFDIFTLYADSSELSESTSAGVVSALESIVPNFDKDEKVSVAFKSLCIGDEPDEKMLEALLDMSDYYLLFLSPDAFEKYAEKLASTDELLPSDISAESVIRFGGASGVYLKSTAFYSLDGVKDLPEDTVVCIKAKTDKSTEALNRKYDDAVSVFKKMLEN